MTEPSRRPGILSRPKVRLVVARIVVGVGVVLAVVAVVTGRWGMLFAGVIVIGLGAALGPARIRR